MEKQSFYATAGLGKYCMGGYGLIGCCTTLKFGKFCK